MFECPLIQSFFFKTNSNYFKKLYSNFKEYPTPDNEGDLMGKGSFGGDEDTASLEGIGLSNIYEVQKVLSLSPSILSKHELHSIFV